MNSILRRLLPSSPRVMPMYCSSLLPYSGNSRMLALAVVVQKVSDGSRSISTTSSLFAEPMKKKKKMDPAVLKAREERKRKKLEKQIRRLEKHQSQFKPLDELEIPVCIIDEPKKRARSLPQLPVEVTDARWRLVKEWGTFKADQVAKEIKLFKRMNLSQEKALNELQLESESLYEAALKIDRDLIPHTAQGPTESPAIENYRCPDGDYIDVSRKWD